MGIAAIVPAILFVVGIGAILASAGGTTYMLAGDTLVALAGLSFVKFSN